MIVFQIQVVLPTPTQVLVAFRRKVMTNLDSTLKSRDITLPTKVHLIKAMVFAVIIFGYELDYEES